MEKLVWRESGNLKEGANTEKVMDGGRTWNPDGTFGQEDCGNDRMEGIRKQL
jgi:hypothetical protein